MFESNSSLCLHGSSTVVQVLCRAGRLSHRVSHYWFCIQPGHVGDALSCCWANLEHQVLAGLELAAARLPCHRQCSLGLGMLWVCTSVDLHGRSMHGQVQLKTWVSCSCCLYLLSPFLHGAVQWGFCGARMPARFRQC